MLVSVILPVYNAEKFLEEAIESVLAQTFYDFELIAINDGSTDSSLAILERFSLADKRVRVISRENLGLIKTLNQGIELAQGDLIARMDADDICQPNRFECQVEFLAKNPDIVCVGAQIQLIDVNGRQIMGMQGPLDHEDIDAANYSGKSHGIVHPTALIRLSALRLIGGYRSVFRHAEDIDLWLRLAEVGRLANLPVSLLKYRQHLNSIGYRYRFEQQYSQWKAVKDAAERRGKIFKIPEPREEEFIVRALLGSVEQKWAWWALKGGHISTARHYALKALIKAPWRPSVWKLMFCCVRGR
jgi:glycosyltransferase involved in cell wall biosynthesis